MGVDDNFEQFMLAINTSRDRIERWEGSYELFKVGVAIEPCELSDDILDAQEID